MGGNFEDFVYELPLVLLEFEIEVTNQDGIKVEPYYLEDFPMIAYEVSNDSPFCVDMEESKFLNDPEHDGTWMIINGMSDDLALINFKDGGNGLVVDAFEVNKRRRGEHISSRIMDVVECLARDNGYSHVRVQPFDSCAQTYWEHRGYEKFGTVYVKKFA